MKRLTATATKDYLLNGNIKKLLNAILSKTTHVRGFLIYALLLLSAPVYHLLDKVSNDAGGLASRYLPLSIALILLLGHHLYIKRKALKYGVLWWIFLLIYWLAISLLSLFIVYVIFISKIDTVYPAVTGLIWAVMTIPSAIAITRYIKQAK